MEQIKDLGSRETGYMDLRFGIPAKARWGLFLCPVCKSEVEMLAVTGRKRKTCSACRGAHQVTHGMSGTRMYHTWRSMMNRCTNPNDKKFRIYGGKGITVCDEWKTFEGFYAAHKDAYQEDLTIDRINSSLGYFPDNVRWIPQRQNSSETTKRRPVTQLRLSDVPGSWEPVKKWESAKQAADALGLVAAHITATCQGKRKTHGGFAWQYTE